MTMPPFTDGAPDALDDNSPVGAALPAWRDEPPQPLAAWWPAAGGAPLALADGDLQLLECHGSWPGAERLGPLQEHLLVIALEATDPVRAWLPGEPPRTAAWPAGSLLLLPAGEVAWLQPPARTALMLLALRPALVYGSDRAPRRLQACIGRPDPVAGGLAQALRAATRGPGAAPDPTFTRHLAQALAAHLRAHHSASAERPGLSRLRLDRVLAHLHARLDQPIDLTQAARVAGCSVSHFAHLFKAAMGVSPMRYLRERRMVRARELVETTALSMGEIGLRVGIPEPAQFSQAFRAHWKTPPSQLRRQA